MPELCHPYMKIIMHTETHNYPEHMAIIRSKWNKFDLHKSNHHIFISSLASIICEVIDLHDGITVTGPTYIQRFKTHIKYNFRGCPFYIELSLP